VGDAKITTSSVSFRVVINRFDFARIRDSGKGTFKNPLDINDDGDRALLGPDLAESVLVWLRAKVDLVGERVVPGSLLIAPIDLCVYCSSILSVPSTYEAKEDVALAPIWNLLVGDAAFGVPFFRALNNGLICGAQLAKTIDQLVIRRTAAKNNGLLFHPEEPSICAAYSTFVANLAEEQTRRASSVAAQMKSARLGHRLTSRMFSGISDEKIALYRAGLPARPHWSNKFNLNRAISSTKLSMVEAVDMYATALESTPMAKGVLFLRSQLNSKAEKIYADALAANNGIASPDSDPTLASKNSQGN